MGVAQYPGSADSQANPFTSVDPYYPEGMGTCWYPSAKLCGGWRGTYTNINATTLAIDFPAAGETECAESYRDRYVAWRPLPAPAGLEDAKRHFSALQDMMMVVLRQEDLAARGQLQGGSMFVTTLLFSTATTGLPDFVKTPMVPNALEAIAFFDANPQYNFKGTGGGATFLFLHLNTLLSLATRTGLHPDSVSFLLNDNYFGSSGAAIVTDAAVVSTPFTFAVERYNDLPTGQIIPKQFEICMGEGMDLVGYLNDLSIPGGKSVACSFYGSMMITALSELFDFEQAVTADSSQCSTKTDLFTFDVMFKFWEGFAWLQEGFYGIAASPILASQDGFTIMKKAYSIFHTHIGNLVKTCPGVDYKIVRTPWVGRPFVEPDGYFASCTWAWSRPHQDSIGLEEKHSHTDLAVSVAWLDHMITNVCGSFAPSPPTPPSLPPSTE